MASGIVVRVETRIHVEVALLESQGLSGLLGRLEQVVHCRPLDQRAVQQHRMLIRGVPTALADACSLGLEGVALDVELGNCLEHSLQVILHDRHLLLVCLMYVPDGSQHHCSKSISRKCRAHETHNVLTYTRHVTEGRGETGCIPEVLVHGEEELVYQVHNHRGPVQVLSGKWRCGLLRRAVHCQRLQLEHLQAGRLRHISKERAGSHLGRRGAAVRLGVKQPKHQRRLYGAVVQEGGRQDAVLEVSHDFADILLVLRAIAKQEEQASHCVQVGCRGGLRSLRGQKQLELLRQG
eukprot:scaffold222325_cov29-Prasinocladus_malaysianus.AAC.2